MAGKAHSLGLHGYWGPWHTKWRVGCPVECPIVLSFLLHCCHSHFSSPSMQMGVNGEGSGKNTATVLLTWLNLCGNHVRIQQPGSPSPPFNQSEPSAGSGPVLMLVWRMIKLKALKNQFTFSAGMRTPIESHHFVTVLCMFPIARKNNGGLHRLFISGFWFCTPTLASKHGWTTCFDFRSP